MKRSKRNLAYLATVLITYSLLIFSGCSESSEEEPDPQSQFVGTWTTENITVAFFVDGKSLEEYILDGGGSADDVTSATQNLFSILEDELGGSEGEVELKADNTYTAKFGNVTKDKGTWSYNPTTETLTFNSDGGQEVDVSSFSSSKIVIEQTGVLSEDIDSDEIEEEIDVYLSYNYIKS